MLHGEEDAPDNRSVALHLGFHALLQQLSGALPLPLRVVPVACSVMCGTILVASDGSQVITVSGLERIPAYHDRGGILPEADANRTVEGPLHTLYDIHLRLLSSLHPWSLAKYVFHVAKGIPSGAEWGAPSSKIRALHRQRAFGIDRPLCRCRPPQHYLPSAESPIGMRQVPRGAVARRTRFPEDLCLARLQEELCWRRLQELCHLRRTHLASASSTSSSRRDPIGLWALAAFEYHSFSLSWPSQK